MRSVPGILHIRRMRELPRYIIFGLDQTIMERVCSIPVVRALALVAILYQCATAAADHAAAAGGKMSISRVFDTLPFVTV